MIIREIPTRKLLGQLNRFEEKYAPEALYFIGDSGLVLSAPKVSIIGSRKASEGGKRRARKLARQLAQGGITVVSGMAEGIDTEAHWAAIRAGGRTFAVLGTPLDRPYPASNRDLFLKLAQSHLVLSQFPVGSRFSHAAFPMRNRTMALLSNATVIVEAGEKSGTMHQAWEAIRLNRPLFLLQSVAEDRELTWPEKVMKYGAQVLTEDAVEPLIENLPYTPVLDDLAIAF